MLRQGAGLQDFGPTSIPAGDQLRTKRLPSLTDQAVAVSSGGDPGICTSTTERLVLACEDCSTTVSSSLSEVPVAAPRPTRKRNRGRVLVPIMAAGVLGLASVWMTNVPRHEEIDFVGMIDGTSPSRQLFTVGDPPSFLSTENISGVARGAARFFASITSAMTSPLRAGQVVMGDSTMEPRGTAGPPRDRYTLEPRLLSGDQAFAAEQPLPLLPAHPESSSSSVTLTGSSDPAVPDALGPADPPMPRGSHVAAAQSEVTPPAASTEHHFEAGAHAEKVEPQALPFFAPARRPSNSDAAARNTASIGHRPAPAIAERGGMLSGLTQPFKRTERREADRTAQSLGPSAKSVLSARLPLPPQPPARQPAASRAAAPLPVRPQTGQLASSRPPEPIDRCRTVAFRFHQRQQLSNADLEFMRRGCRLS
jgi:hypothetical protein